MMRASLALGLLAASGGAYAQSDGDYGHDNGEATKGFYIGGAATQAKFDDRFAINDLDKRDTSWKAIAGWRFADQFALEGSYVDFGKSTAPGSLGVNPFAQEAKAWVLQGVGYLPIPYVDLFAKVGVTRVDAEGRGADVPFFDDKHTEFAYGWGAQYRWRSLALRAEYERFDTPRLGDLDLVSLGLTYTFAMK